MLGISEQRLSQCFIYSIKSLFLVVECNVNGSSFINCTNKGLSVECCCFNTAGIVCSPALFVPVACVMRLQCACAS